MPGPASSEGDRPPTNPAIQVRFSTALQQIASVADRVCGRFLYATLIYLKPSLQCSKKKSKAPSTGKESRLYTLSLSVAKRNT